MENTSIVVCGEKFDIGTRVVLWDEPGGLNGYDTSASTYWTKDRKTGKSKKVTIKGKRYGKRRLLLKPTLPYLQKVVNQFVIHHSGLYRSVTTQKVLHDRGLSCQFILDDDGTLYQTMDAKERAWHAGYNNQRSVGVEIDSRAVANRFPDAYSEKNQKRHGVGPRRKFVDMIHGRAMNGYEYSDGQYQTLIRLTKVLAEVFPLMKTPEGLYDVDFPRDSNGEIIKTEILKPLEHKGFIKHFQITDGKIDPISLDFERLLEGVKNNNPFQERMLVGLNSWLDRQDALIQLGYDPGTPDGVFGPKTSGALKEFQKDFGLKESGQWNSETKAQLKKELKNWKVQMESIHILSNMADYFLI